MANRYDQAMSDWQRMIQARDEWKRRAEIAEAKAFTVSDQLTTACQEGLKLQGQVREIKQLIVNLEAESIRLAQPFLSWEQSLTVENETKPTESINDD